jgi:Lon protease-like protein
MALRIFEPRYLSMVSRCMRAEHGFGVVLILDGSEAGSARFSSTGTCADIVDWSRGSDGLLAVVAQGRERFTVSQSHREPDGLYIGEIELLPAEPSQPVPERHLRLGRLLAKLLEDGEDEDPELESRLDDATWVGYRLAELLPVPATTKQSLLELTDPIRRLEMLATYADGVDAPESLL